MCHQQFHPLISRHSTAHTPDECGKGSFQPKAKLLDLAELFLIYTLALLEQTRLPGDCGRMLHLCLGSGSRDIQPCPTTEDKIWGLPECGTRGPL